MKTAWVHFKATWLLLDIAAVPVLAQVFFPEFFPEFHSKARDEVILSCRPPPWDEPGDREERIYGRGMPAFPSRDRKGAVLAPYEFGVDNPPCRRQQK